MVLMAAAVSAVPASGAEKGGDPGLEKGGDPGLEVATTASRVTVSAADRVILVYRYADVPFKPYVEQYLTPGGINVLRDSPDDHKHHHALMFAVAVDGVNFWEEHEAPGRQAHRSIDDVRVEQHGDLARAGFTEGIDWVNPRDGKLMIREARTIQVSRGTGLGASLLTWQSAFTLPAGNASATLTGSGYFGLGARFLTSMDTGGTFRNADGKSGVEGTNNVRSRWCAYAARAEGHPVTVAMFSPANGPRQPAVWFTMDDSFAYLAATLGLHHAPLVLQGPEPLVVRYGVAVWDGTPEADQIEKLYEHWTAGAAR